jgi:hypothetical protein
MELAHRLNPDLQGRLLKTIMEGDMQNCVIDNKAPHDSNVEDLRLILTLTKDYGKNVNIDDLLQKYLQETKKNDEVDSKERFIVALLHLKNGGIFVQAGTSAKMWRKTYFGKSSYRTNS